MRQIGDYFANPLWWRIKAWRRVKINKDSILFNNEYKFIYKNKAEFVWSFRQVMEIFYDKAYDIPVKGSSVLDIGANIGDTAIYFIGEGKAKKVVALEPFPSQYKIAKSNIKANSMQNKIMLLNQGLSSKKEEISLPKEEVDSGILNAKDSAVKNGTQIKFTTLPSLIKKYNLEDAIVKMDCQGCEYESILKSSNETLRHFSGFVIEYHSRFEPLYKKMKNAGFKLVSNGVLEPEVAYWIRDDQER